MNSLVSWFTNTNVICAQTKTPKDVQLWPSLVAPGMAGGKKERKAGSLGSRISGAANPSRERESLQKNMGPSMFQIAGRDELGAWQLQAGFPLCKIGRRRISSNCG